MIHISKYGEVTIDGPDNIAFMEWVKAHKEHHKKPWREALMIYMDEINKGK